MVPADHVLPGPTRPRRAILLGVSGHPRALAAIRSLGRAGIEIIGVEGDDAAQSAYSRYLSRTYRIGARPEEALPFLDWLGRQGGGVLICLDDDFLILVARHSQVLSRHFTLSAPPWETFQRVMDHAQLYAIAREMGLRTPEFVRPRNDADLDRIVTGLDLARHEYLLKTVPGTVPADIRNGRFTKVAGADPATIRANCAEIASRLGAPPLIVEVVPGEANQCIGVSMVVDRRHEPVLTFCMKRLKLYTYSRGGFVHPYELGANVYCESVRDDEAVEAAHRLVRAAEYWGAITVEFRRDTRHEDLILIKCDPRVVRPCSLSTALGLDVPTALYRVSVGDTVDAPRAYPTGVAWLWGTMFLETLWNQRANRPVRQGLLDLWRNAGQIRAHAQWDLRDPVPFLMHVQ
jgi:D-aspartate ligase